jgi:hypothetical protein
MGFSSTRQTDVELAVLCQDADLACCLYAAVDVSCIVHVQEKMKWLPFMQTWSTESRHKTRSEPQAQRTAMEHITIDLGGRESQICVRNDKGEILEERRHPTQRDCLRVRVSRACLLTDSQII